MTRGFSAMVLVALVSLWGCSPTIPARPTARPFDDVRRLAILVSGESSFTVVEHQVEPGRTFDEVLAWYPYGAALRPIAKLVHRGINWLLNAEKETTVARIVNDVSPRTVVASAMAQKLQESGWFDEVRTLEAEPTGADRRRDDALVRVTVPAWGLVRVRDGDPDLVSSFADVRAEMTAPGTGVVLWEKREDVTAAAQVPLGSFTDNRDFARQEIVDVLERAGQRLASELLYARSAGR